MPRRSSHSHRPPPSFLEHAANPSRRRLSREQRNSHQEEGNGAWRSLVAPWERPQVPAEDPLTLQRLERRARNPDRTWTADERIAWQRDREAQRQQERARCQESEERRQAEREGRLEALCTQRAADEHERRRERAARRDAERNHRPMNPNCVCNHCQNFGDPFPNRIPYENPGSFGGGTLLDQQRWRFRESAEQRKSYRPSWWPGR